MLSSLRTKKRKTPVIYPLENFFRKLRRHFSRSEWTIRRLRLSTSDDTSPDPGLLLIQIDGLSRRQMERAMERGRLPFLRRLLRMEHYQLHTFYSGLPSSTPAVQGELHYGVCCAVPAFSFLDRRENRIVTMFKPDMAKMIEAKLAEKDIGLLEGGSSWSNIYTGGAKQEEAHFCAASIGWGDMLKTASPLGFLSIVLMQIPAVLRLIAALIAEVFLAIYDVVHGVYHGQNPAREIKFVLARVFICAGLRDFITVGAKVDLARGLPIIHVNFLGYDEQSHRRGPTSAFAHWALKGIDRSIEHLYYAAQRSARRDYRIWIFSDHGQESARPFPESFEGGVEEVIRRGLERFEKQVARRVPRSQLRDSRANWGGGKRTLQRLEERSKTEYLTEEEKASFSVTAMGPVGHVYFARKFSVEEKREFAAWLVHEGKVPSVVYLTSPEAAEWVHPKGVTKVPEEAPSILPHPEALRGPITEDLLALLQNADSGDLMILGWNPAGDLWTFANEQGAHAGPGPVETQGFAMLPPKTRLPPEARHFIRPSYLRRAALHLLGRRPLPSPERHSSTPLPQLKLRVMTYNVHSCFGMDGKVSPTRIARVIDMHDPDVVALQEIDLGRVRSRGHDQARMIAEELGFHFNFCPTVVRGNELYGHALLTRYPAEIVQTGILPAGPRPQGKEPRGALWIKMHYEGMILHIVNTHFGLGRYERVAQASDMLSERWIGSLGLDEAIILCGDFNMMPESMPYRAITRRLRDVQRDVQKKNRAFRPLKTFAALYPFSRIDHIFVSNHFEVEQVLVPKNHLTRVASDHLPLIADLIVRPHALEHARDSASTAEGQFSNEVPRADALNHMLGQQKQNQRVNS
jgi:endonuclease/exonuclease/phosphatase family metal-dependent hydrolase